MTNPPQLPYYSHRRRNILLSLCLIFLCIGGAFFAYWWIWGQFLESTNDAYVGGNMLIISPLEAGLVTKIYTDDTQLVEAGQLIIELDFKSNQIALQRAEEELAQSIRDVTQYFIKVEELKAKKESREADFLKKTQDYHHRQGLIGSGSISLEDFEHAQADFFSSYGALIEVERELEAAEAEIYNTEISNHPLVEKAKSMVRKSFLALHRCRVLAPVRGIVSQRKVQVGQWVEANTPLLSIIPINEIWVDANFREVDLKNIRIGQPVTLTSEMYGDSVKFKGYVVGLNPGTGSVFSILPPQNASGNWIKIIQRIPVRISLDSSEILKHPLILGLSMNVTVHTHHREGLQVPQQACEEAFYKSDVYKDELRGAEELIDQIIAENESYASSPSF